MKIKSFILIIFSFILMGEKLTAQSGFVLYSFEDCSLTDFGFTLPDAIDGAMSECRCGVIDNAIYLDGVDDYITFPQAMSDIMNQNFTLDFYFWLDDSDKETDILSNKSDCTTIDSSLTIRYFGNTREILVELGSSINNFFSVKSILPEDRCWNRITLVKFNLEYLVYINNRLTHRIISRESIIFSTRFPFALANNPCTNPDSKKFGGRIDEFRITQRALSDLEIVRNYLFPDQIVTQDTTIFKGESIQINLGNTCAPAVSWSPDAFLDNGDIPSPIATPDESTTFTVTLDNGTCITTDQVTIYIADRDKLNCDNILLPKAFTPNNDGLNDRYGISNTFIIESLDYFEIYDRWGSKIWSAQNATDQWDGSFNGQPVNPGSLIYKIKYTCGSEERVKVNNFTLLR